jgi:hypothetical protein
MPVNNVSRQEGEKVTAISDNKGSETTTRCTEEDSEQVLAEKQGISSSCAKVCDHSTLAYDDTWLHAYYRKAKCCPRSKCLQRVQNITHLHGYDSGNESFMHFYSYTLYKTLHMGKLHLSISGIFNSTQLSHDIEVMRYRGNGHQTALARSKVSNPYIQEGLAITQPMRECHASNSTFISGCRLLIQALLSSHKDLSFSFAFFQHHSNRPDQSQHHASAHALRPAALDNTTTFCL